MFNRIFVNYNYQGQDFIKPMIFLFFLNPLNPNSYCFYPSQISYPNTLLSVFNFSLFLLLHKSFKTLTWSLIHADYTAWLFSRILPLYNFFKFGLSLFWYTYFASIFSTTFITNPESHIFLFGFWKWVRSKVYYFYFLFPWLNMLFIILLTGLFDWQLIFNNKSPQHLIFGLQFQRLSKIN